MAGNYTGLTDSELDAAWAATYDGAQMATGQQKIDLTAQYSDMAQEILTRLSSVTNFVFGAFGGNAFPMYTKTQESLAGGFVQSAQAQASIGETVTNDVNAIKQSANNALTMFGNYTKLVAVIAVGIVLLIVFLKFGKRS
jgi:uncharacterized protein YukE